MRQDSKKIIFVIPSLELGGMERVMSEVINYISSYTPSECHLILYGRTGKEFYEISKNVKVYKPTFKFNHKRRMWMTIRTMIFIRSTIKKINPDTILSFGEIWNNLVLLSHIGLRMPIYVSDRSSPNKKLGFIHEILRKYLYPKASGVIVQTLKAKEILKSKFKNNNIQVIGNPIREIRDLYSVEKENIIVSVGRLIKTKHFDRLIDIFSQINNQDWKLIIVGGNSNKQLNSIKLKKQIKELGMERNIVLEGQQKNIEKYLQNASIFALTSSSEGFPNVIGEALAEGLPVVAYDCIAGPSEMIEEGRNGFLIPVYNDLLFKQKLICLINNRKLREEMGAYGKNSIKKFSTDIIASQYYDFITSNLERK